MSGYTAGHDHDRKEEKASGVAGLCNRRARAASCCNMPRQRTPGRAHNGLMELLADPKAWLAFTTLLLLEIVLGIDNVIFISILAGKLPENEQKKARQTGLGLALITRVLLLMSLSWLVKLTNTIFAPFGHELSGRDLILIIGGLFLIAKSTHEIHQKLEGEEGHASKKVRASFVSVIIQILLLDIVFSLDSVITAVGTVDHLAIMVGAVVVATGIMILASTSISGFVDRHPSIKVLALSFLIMIGFTLIVEGLDHHVPKGYVYFAMAFSMFVEMLNIRMRKKRHVVRLNEPYSSREPKPEGE
jgi:predicted tellurium resistance membrane protein TerC